MLLQQVVLLQLDPFCRELGGDMEIIPKSVNIWQEIPDNYWSPSKYHLCADFRVLAMNWKAMTADAMVEEALPELPSSILLLHSARSSFTKVSLDHYCIQLKAPLTTNATQAMVVKLEESSLESSSSILMMPALNTSRYL